MTSPAKPPQPDAIPAGRPWPLGVEWIEAEDAFNFALYSRHANRVTLLCYGEKDPSKAVFEFRFQHPAHKTGSIWHCRIPADDLRGATLYAYRVEGPHDPERGHRFDPQKILLDPYAPAVFFPPSFSRKACSKPGPTDGRAPLGRLPKKEVAAAPLDNGPRYTCRDGIVYELHVKGFTARANSGVTPAKRGTFAGVAEKIPYLKDLGVTIVELLPVQQFDPQEGNYWGYMTLHFFSPHQQYALGEAFEEFRAMVQAFHEAGIEVWLDVVYNHTAEGDQNGPTYSYRGVDNDSYYLLSPDLRHYVNDTGCGNTLRTGHPAGRVLVLESLRFWARLEQNRDIFRFFKLMIAFRQAHPSIGRPVFWREDVKWFGADGPVDLGAESRSLAYFLNGESMDDDDLYVRINGHWEDRTFTVQAGAASGWRRVVDTSKPSPEDIVEPGREPGLEGKSYLVRARSVVVLRKEQG